jgi:hypothetical protein
MLIKVRLSKNKNIKGLALILLLSDITYILIVSKAFIIRGISLSI